MKKIILIVLSVMVLAVLVFFILTSSGQEPAEGNSLLNWVQLERIPSGTEFTPGMHGMLAVSFKKDDQMAISGEADFIGKATFTARISREEGSTTAAEVMPPLSIKPGTFGFCCISLPQDPGEYFFHFYTNGTEEALSPLSFEVTD
jgi:hypothetical protein